MTRYVVDASAVLAVIEREIVMRLAFEVAEYLVVIADYPSCRRDIDVLELAFDVVFVLQSMRDDVKLQLSDGTENQVVVAQRLEQLRGAFLA